MSLEFALETGGGAPKLMFLGLFFFFGGGSGFCAGVGKIFPDFVPGKKVGSRATGGGCEEGASCDLGFSGGRMGSAVLAGRALSVELSVLGSGSFLPQPACATTNVKTQRANNAEQKRAIERHIFTPGQDAFTVTQRRETRKRRLSGSL